MNRADMVQKIVDSHHVTKREANRILFTVLDSIIASVKKGDTFSVVGFGSFKKVTRAARKGFNPRDGKAIKIAARTLPKFTPGQKFKDAIDPKAAKRRATK